MAHFPPEWVAHFNRIFQHKLLEEKLDSISIQADLHDSFRKVLSDLSEQEQRVQDSTVILYKKELTKIEKQTHRLQERIIDTDEPELVTLYEKKMKGLIKEKMVLTEKSESAEFTVRNTLRTRGDAKYILLNP